ncbi:hypothetical protein H1R20_g3123, partial [Candolleomyces eurysporus]
MANLSPTPRTTRSGRRFSSMVDWGTVQPVVCPPNFSLSPLLKQAIEFNSDGCTEAFDFGGTTVLNLPLDAKRPASDINPVQPSGSPQKKVKRSHVHRRKKRNQRVVQDGHQAAAKAATARTLCDLVEEAAQTTVQVAIQLESLPASSCGYRAKSKGSSKPGVHAVEYYKNLGYSVLKNDGSKTFPLIDSSTGRVFAVVVGKPKDDPTFDLCCEGAFEAMKHTRQTETFNYDETHHPRGHYAVINTGITRGPGSGTPCNLNNGSHSNAVEKLLCNTHICRLATYASAAFSVWAPDLFQYYKAHLDPLMQKENHLKKNFEKSIFTSAAFNLGPNVCTLSHRDCMNCPFGWCAIQSLGQFDHTLGGHLVLEDLKLLVEFPPGCLILIPSAVLTHANTPIQVGEMRASFTQYCAGALFRYVDNNFMTQDEFRASVTGEEFEAKMKEKETRWKKGLELFSTLDDLVERAKAFADQMEKTVEEGQV